MSRCFPYPPPGHALHGAKNGALIESIKLHDEQGEKEKRRENKNERRERKEKRKERKEKRKVKEEKINPNLDKNHTFLKTCLDHKDVPSKSGQFELSSLTEEHGYPESIPVPSSSYESTENNKKRKRNSSAIDSSQVHGKILIRPPFRRESKFHSFSNGQQRCSISRQADCLTQHKDDAAFSRDRSGISDGEICSTSGLNADIFVSGERRISNAAVNPMQGVESQYNFLLEKLCSPGVDVESLDSDWLFHNEDNRAERRQRLGSDGIMSCARSSARAEYLHEINAYALPYVVPY